MASKILNTKIIIRNDTAQNWTSANPTPSKAELCFENDTGKYKIGDGVSAWKNLPYFVHIDDSTKSSLNSLITMLNDDEFGKVDDVTVNGTSVLNSSDKTAKITIATINFSEQTQNTTNQSLTQNSVVLHKISRTGSYSDLLNKPSVIDNLNSTSTTDLLSANQGHIIKNMIQSIPSAQSYTNIQAMVSSLNSLSSSKLNIGINLFIQQLQVPDFWVYSVESTSVTYSYTDDASFISQIKTNGFVQVGYYKVSLLETEKVDLSGYVTTQQLNSAVETINGSITSLQNRVKAIEDDSTILRSDDTFVLNGGTSAEV